MKIKRFLLLILYLVVAVEKMAVEVSLHQWAEFLTEVVPVKRMLATPHIMASRLNVLLVFVQNDHGSDLAVLLEHANVLDNLFFFLKKKKIKKKS